MARAMQNLFICFKQEFNGKTYIQIGLKSKLKSHYFGYWSLFGSFDRFILKTTRARSNLFEKKLAGNFVRNV